VQQNILDFPSHLYHTLQLNVSRHLMNSVTLEVEGRELTEVAGGCIRSLLGEGIVVEAPISFRWGRTVYPTLLRNTQL